MYKIWYIFFDIPHRGIGGKAASDLGVFLQRLKNLPTVFTSFRRGVPKSKDTDPAWCGGLNGAIHGSSVTEAQLALNQ